MDAFAADTPTSAATQAPADQVPYDLSAEKMSQDMLLLILMIFFIFWFLLINPHRKRVKQHETMVKGLAKGNKVLTSGGILGVIIKFDGDDVAIVEIAPNVRVRVSRNMISEVLADKSTAESANDN